MTEGLKDILTPHGEGADQVSGTIPHLAVPGGDARPNVIVPEKVREQLAGIHPRSKEGFAGQVGDWFKGRWDWIKHTWNVSKEHLLHASIGGWHMTPLWLGGIGGAGAIGLLAAAEGWRRHRKKKRAAQAA